MNHLHPPFNDVKARRAVLMALDQEEYMRALVGDDDSLWKPLPGYFTPGTPLYNEEGGDILKGKRDIAAAKKLLAESGYNDQPVTCVVAQDQPITKAQGDVTAELLKRHRHERRFRRDRLGHDRPAPRAEVAARPRRLGMFHSWHAGADCINPAVYIAIRANGDGAWFGWPNVPAVEKEVTAWFDAKNLDEEKAATRRLNKAALDNVVYAPTGFFLDLSGVAQERLRHRQRPAAVLLGRGEEGLRSFLTREAGERGPCEAWWRGRPRRGAWGRLFPSPGAGLAPSTAFGGPLVTLVVPTQA